ncbi:MAG: arylsulfatase [Gemmatales bacterium]|nr:MAG: arylsulfatase [Gemmatales bacterium]
MNRFRVHLSLFFLAVLVLMPAVTRAEDRSRPPNIVFILADDLGYAELGCYGQKKIRTPNLDRLASQGMRFTQAYSGNAVCAPSRCVLMTGKHPGHAWVRTNRSAKPEGQEPIPPEEITIAEILRDHGYKTGAFGKWGLGPPASMGDPLNQGFDRFFGYNCQGHAHSYYPSYLWSNDKRIKLNNDPPVPGHASLPKGADPNDPKSYERFKGKDYAPDRINKQVLDFIRTHKEEPFFLYYPSIIPHVALHVPDEDLKPYLALKWHDPPFTRAKGYGYTPHFTPRAAYAAMISRLDRYVGNVLKLLDELQLADNTVVFFSSDNGTTTLKQEVDYEFFESVGPLRGLKGSLYEGGIRVPLIVRWPGKVKPGTVSDRIVGFEDILPTLAEIAGASKRVPRNIDGISFVPTLLGKKQPPREFLYREFPSYGGQQSIRVGKWKAIRRNLLKNPNAPIELYNLEEDVGESKNVADKHPQIVARLSELMRREHTPSKVFPFKALDR